MNKTELKEALIILCIKPKHYTIDDEPYKDSSWVLTTSFNNLSSNRKYQMWSVFLFERGSRYDEEAFYTEEDACKYIYEKLKHKQELIMKFKLKD